MGRTDDELAAITIGERVPHDAPIELVPYDAGWPVLFEREATRIRATLGERALLIEHVGSTAVPGLVAKPRIDVLLVVRDPADETTYLPELEAAAYVLRIREPTWHEHRTFKGPDTDVNVHVFGPGCSEIERMVGFRDRLRADTEERDRYAAAKRQLAARRWRWVQDYADAKTEVVEAIIARAGLPGPLADGGGC